MSRTLLRPVLAAAALAAVLAGCSSTPPTPAAPVAPAGSSSASSATTATTSTTATSSASAAPSTSAASAPAISIKDFMFTVPTSVPAGATVTVTNNDNEAHTVTSKDGGFDVKVAGHGGTAQLTAPAKAGRYALTCDFHANMTTTLVVQ